MEKIPGKIGTKSTRRKSKAKKTFRIWDVEGHVFPDGTHRLTLLANSDGEFIEDPDGLSTRYCIDFLTRKRPRAFDCWFAFGYDVNKILTNVPLRGDKATLEELWKRGRTWWIGNFIKYIPRKFFTLRSKGSSFHSTDTFSFFQMSFLKACKEWGIDASKIERGKKDRSIFNTWTPLQIREYNFWELRIAKRLMEKLLVSFEAIGVVPASWHGPGAIAARWLQKHGLKQHYAPIPSEIQTPILHAYFGGRIDCSIVGEALAYQYDIASAYPYALCDCISLAPIRWRHYEGTNLVRDRHALYHVRWSVPHTSAWGPFPWRSKSGSVLFPTKGEGWYWGVEVDAAEKLFGVSCIERIECWYPDGSRRFPFKEEIEKAYQTRLKVGKNTGAGIAIKLVLNSLYGKLCQHVGDGNKVPRWQNYVWAGYITAFTRAKLLAAIKQVGITNVLAIATDGIFTTQPIANAWTKEQGPAPLGVFEDKGVAPTLFIAPGVYAVFKEQKPSIIKARGFPANINYGWVLRQWGCNTNLDVPNSEGKLINATSSKYESFIGMGKAIHQDKPHGVFIEEERKMNNVTIVGTSKRMPNPFMFATEEPWQTFPLVPRPRPEETISYPYSWKEEFESKEDNEIQE